MIMAFIILTTMVLLGMVACVLLAFGIAGTGLLAAFGCVFLYVMIPVLAIVGTIAIFNHFWGK